MGRREGAGVNAGPALVTGAGGFIGGQVVLALRRRGVRVRAAVHRPEHVRRFRGVDGVEAVVLELLDRRSLARAVEGTSELYHFAASLDARGAPAALQEVNVEGTRALWECACAAGVGRLLYCSSAAVYGLLAAGDGPVSEAAVPRAVEPYGRSKLLGERAAQEVSDRAGARTTVIRPVAVFGPGEETRLGRALRRAAVTRIVFGGPFRRTGFSFVHVEDVAEAAVHLLRTPALGREVYNVTVERPIAFDDALRAYRRALGRDGLRHVRARVLAGLSAALQAHPAVGRACTRVLPRKVAFTVWRPGFDVTYCSQRLQATGYRFRWVDFEAVIGSCLAEAAT
jgi:nucleoside-diphosphate-sugar epimerase